MGSALKRFDAFQQAHRPLAIAMAVLKKSSDDQGGNLAALVAYYGFFSLFPLLLVFTTILGYVLAGDRSTQTSIENSIKNQFPSVGSSLHLGHISGSVVALVIGVLLSLYSGLGVTSAAQNLMNTLWAVPIRSRPNFVKSRLRGAGLLVALGVLFVVSTVVTGAVSSVFGGPGAKVLGYVVSLLVNGALFFTAFRLMSESEITKRALLPGTVLAAVLWTFLQTIGSVYLHHVSAGGDYGVFATTIALLVWLHLGAQVFMYSAELNTVLARGLYPRSFFGPPAAPADRDARTALARTQEHSAEQRVDVVFHDTPPADEPPAS